VETNHIAGYDGFEKHLGRRLEKHCRNCEGAGFKLGFSTLAKDGIIASISLLFMTLHTAQSHPAQETLSRVCNKQTRGVFSIRDQKAVAGRVAARWLTTMSSCFNTPCPCSQAFLILITTSGVRAPDRRFSLHYITKTENSKLGDIWIHYRSALTYKVKLWPIREKKVCYSPLWHIEFIITAMCTHAFASMKMYEFSLSCAHIHLQA
jgi:hypothetical protein